MERKPSGGMLLNKCLFGAYLFIILAIDLYINHFHYSMLKQSERPFLVLLSVPLFLVLVGVPPLFRVLRPISIKPRAPASGRGKRMVLLLGFGITALILLVWLFAYHWGVFSPDSYEQLEQAQTGVYSDWHPVWHTLLFFSLPLKLFGSRLAIVPFQLFFFSVAMGCCFLTLNELSGIRYALAALLAVMLNPVLLDELVFPWKDTAFAMTAMLASLMALRLWCLERDWTHSLGGAVLLGLLLANATLFRHNGILFSGFLLIALFFIQKKKNWVVMLAVFALFLVAVKGPLYAALDVEKPERRTLETMGLPLTVIANVVTQRPDLLDEETEEFAVSIAPLEVWQERYECGDFNSFKFMLDLETRDRIDAVGRGKILRMMRSCFRNDPLDAAKGLFCLTDLVYAVEDTGIGDLQTPAYNLYEYRLAYGIVKEYRQIFSRSIFHYLGYIGTTLAVMLAAMLAKCSLSDRQDWKRILLCLSVFCYDFGTMLLLTGEDHRFFQVSFLVCPVFTLLMFYDKTGKNGEG